MTEARNAKPNGKTRPNTDRGLYKAWPLAASERWLGQLQNLQARHWSLLKLLTVSEARVSKRLTQPHTGRSKRQQRGPAWKEPERYEGLD